MRLRRIPGTKERLQNYKDLVAFQPQQLKGKWQAYFKDKREDGKDYPIALEIGCGRGRFITNSANAYPNKNFVGLELREEMVMDCIDKLVACEATNKIPANVCFLWQNAQELGEIFAPGEVQTIYLNFSDPWPKKRHQKRRLTHLDFLRNYQTILDPEGSLILKTDNKPMFEFSLNQLLQAGFKLTEVNYNYPLQGATDDVPTEYELRYRRQGKPIYRCVAKFLALPEQNSKQRKAEEMKYISTRDNIQPMNGAAAIRSGMVPGGGLFVPQTIPAWQEPLEALAATTYQQLAEKILCLYLTDFKQEKIKQIVADSYNENNFKHPLVAPLVPLADDLQVLELWHGPTAAFKDMALQIMPRLLVESVAIEGGSQEVDILVATSGDTGKAALEGFKNVPGIKVIVFYPHNGVSQAQYLQMATTDGNNTSVVAVKGNFDHCQTGVKEIFANQAMNDRLAAKGKEFSSANSINWGRLLPQIVYYFWSYAQLLQSSKIKPGDKFDVVVPTGNFGNILAGYYAMAMGLPINKLVCASNSNKVLADVLATGVYDRRRDFVKTTSPSMDILVSSNFERFFYAMSGGDGKMVASAFKDLNEKGYFEVEPSVKAKWQEVMVGGYCQEADVLATIKKYHSLHGYTLDPHTAVAVKVYEDYKKANQPTCPGVVVATASPFKFGRDVLAAINGKPTQASTESDVLAELSALAKMPIHFGLQEVESKPILHNTVIEVAEMPAIVGEILSV